MPLCYVCHAVRALLYLSFVPKGVLHIDIFLSAELRLPDWFIITEDEFLKKAADVRSRRTSSLEDQEC